MCKARAIRRQGPMGFPRVTRQHESEQRRRAMKGLVLIPNVVKRRWHQHILHVHYARRLRLQLLDVLAPGIGEIIGDSQREERLDVLDARMTERGVDKDHDAWYRESAPLRHGAAHGLRPRLRAHACYV